MKQAASLDLDLGMLLPGIKIKTSATDFYPIEQMQMQQFDGERWVPIGDVMSGAVGG
jgi:branched-chain amino acid transport system substrate-binding protein